jgi:mannosyl-oligosaccharide alpha-1,3-glucosidase
MSLPMVLTMGLSGFPFSGADVLGFFKDPESELAVRWYQAGAFQPFFRGHAHIDTKRREPWLFGEPYTSAIRKAIQMRYRLLPYWYTLFWRAYTDGEPIIRPLFFEYPRDRRLFAMDDQYLLGKDLLVKPILSKAQTRTQVLLPGVEFWYDFETGFKYAPGQVEVTCPLDKIPVFVRGGTILPLRERRRRSSSLMQFDPLTLLIILDKKGQARGELYLDDGLTFDYQQKDSYLWKRLSYNEHKLTSKDISQGRGSTSFNSPVVIERIIVLVDSQVHHSPKRIVVDGRSKGDLEFSYESASSVNQTSRIIIKKPDVKLVDNWSIHFVF